MKRVILYVLLLLSAIGVSAAGKWEADKLVDPHTVDATRYVLDDLGYLADVERDSLDMLCKALDNDADLETAIVMLDKIDDDPFAFAHELYDKWGLGRDDRGLLLLLVMEQHDWRFVTGYGAEGDLPDALLGRIGKDVMAPRFRNEAYYDGIRNGFEEVYHILTDSTYKDQHYGISYLVNNDAESYSDTSLVDEDDESSWGDIMIGIWFVMCAIGLGISSDRASMSSLEDVSAEKDLRFSDDRKINEIRILANDKYEEWSVWSSKSGCCLRYIVVDFSFILVAYLAYGSGSAGLMAFIGVVIYLSLVALIWCWKANKLLKKTPSDTLKAYIQTKAVAESFTVGMFCKIAPHIMCVFYRRLMRQQEKRKSKLFWCPTCGCEISKAPDVEYKPTGAKFYELDNSIMKYEMNECENGHKVILLMPGRNYCHYKKMCEVCGTYTYSEAHRTVVKEATEQKGGVDRVTYRCDVCKKEIIVEEASPKLTSSSSSSSSSSRSSGGSRSYSSGGSHGGSRGGGRSGGGGAGGRW